MTIAGGAVSYAPSTHTRAKYHQPHRSGGKTFIRDSGNQERALVDSPPEESAGRTTDDQTTLEGTDDGGPDTGGGCLNILKRAARRQIGQKERGDGQDAVE